MAERKYKNFILEDLFEKIKTEKIKGKANDFPTRPSGEYVVPLLTAGVNNQGLARFAKREQCKTILKNVITISANGANSGATFYQNGEFSVLQDAYAIKLKSMDIPNAQCGIYLTACIRRVLVGNYNWVCKAGWERIKNLSIQLPITATGSIDWDFMTDYIRELERERIRELDAYLKAAGLDSYELNAEDKRVLALYREALEHKDEPEKCELQFGKFRLNELFDIETTWIYGKNKQYQTRYNQKESGSVAVVSGVTVNNGINYYTKDNLNSDEIFKDCLTISTRGEYSGTVFYHDEEFALANNILVMPMPGWSKEAKLYMMVVLKSLPFGGYNGYPTKDKLSESCIELPINDTGDINFDFIKKYIKAIEKISIANVVKYKNKVIAATKQVVKENSVSDAAAA